MSKERTRESINKNFGSARRWRWAVLFSVTALFSIILFPNLLVTRHKYDLGDVAERDIKSPRDFFIEDTAATDKNRQQAVDAVLTVYDYDAGLAGSLTRKVSDVFADMRSSIQVPDENRPQQPVVKKSAGLATDKAPQAAPIEIIDKRKYLEEKLSIRVSKGAFIALEKVRFSEEISDSIN